eukprot:gb/GECH01003795.1/.p1 GENE.gb/GECH01003795.1/~~gb/GECH01003795.1/.p1  ORF type:complete len:617 (+),score=90.02 gb/GECH01003795.1/:1-1851(+)
MSIFLKRIFWGDDASQPTYINIAKDVPREVDYIVVGGGSSGCMLVGELWERMNREKKHGTLLLLESGHLPSKRSENSQWWPSALNTDQDWKYRSTQQKNLNNRTMYANQGRVLGGSSVLNATIYVRGTPEEYNFWGVNGWDADGVLPHLKNIEAFNEFKGDNVNSEYGRGKKGKIHIERAPRTNFNQVLLDSAKEILEVSEETFDYNQHRDEKKTAALTQFNTTQGKRNDGYRAIIRPLLEEQEAMGSDQCTFTVQVVTGCTVSQLLIDENSKQVQGVQAKIDGYTNENIKIAAKKEVILSSGTLSTPKILMLSGIGDKDHLDSVGINTICHLPPVGQNLQDHLMMNLLYLTRKECEYTPQNGTDLMMFEDISEEEEIMETMQDNEKHERHLSPMYQISSFYGQDSVFSIIFFLMVEGILLLIPGMQYILKYYWIRWMLTECYRLLCWTFRPLLNIVTRRTVGFLVVNSHPRSRGYVFLKSKDPSQPVHFDYQLCSHPSDIVISRKAVERALKLGQAKPFVEQYSPILATPHIAANIEGAICQNSYTLYHPVGTCRMGNKGDKNAVVDERLKVQGVKGLRIADGSIIPFITSGNPNATCFMIGDKAAALIMEDCCS